MPTQVKVLVVDDSAFMRRVIIKMLESDSEIEVVAYARNGEEALDKIKRYKPDVITLDVEMPGMTGIETLEKIMCSNPLPVLMLSSVTTRGAQATIEALELGAVDFVAKPEKRIQIGELADELPEKVKMAAQVSVKKICRKSDPNLRNSPIKSNENIKEDEKKAPSLKKPNLEIDTKKRSRLTTGKKKIDLVVVGTSTGGPAALHTLVSMLPADFPVPVLIVQHMPKGFTATLAQRLNSIGTIPVKEAEDGDLIEKGKALLGPAGYQMQVVREKGIEKVKISTQSPISILFKPSVDVLFLSVAENYGGNSLGVIMTGMGNDGLRGLTAMKEKGAYGLAEAESSCVVYGMPRAVNEAGLTDNSVPLEKLADEIVNFVTK